MGTQVDSPVHPARPPLVKNNSLTEVPQCWGHRGVS